ncbi:GDP/UDP-N,N'-diacetylbacillosamine 2-epimerase (hydrolysing) [Brevundimonas alba]|uniref:GDP/UDP-N,N'-diacetylbacillosamine 2-epimerase (Hydrolysing) n=2 Tax=Brevundimonas alba TaxID=74314 RepID=A0A7X6BMP3_9CAUL|nr:UDP-N-acetylglucosamine 2-epimerase [Brevundimonas alba]NJC41288.1 GDP/UDP-N,N'-diacetylbacillosamine 2-epimerase (hydrolysing) [Brevundimonas alba]
MRRICYVSGTRADFGLMQRTLLAIDGHPDLSLSVIVTGMHLSREHGHTVDEVAAAGFDIVDRVPVALEPATGATMARGIGAMIPAFVDAMEAARPDIVLLLGDRGEMLAGAIAAIHLNLPVAHVCGGERSGTVDEPIRHAISKLSHLHFAATEGARERLIRMGEAPEHVHVVGAPGIDGLTDGPLPDRAAVMAAQGLDPARPFALMVYHPVLQEADRAASDTAILVDQILAAGFQLLALMPNADAGSDGVRQALRDAEHRLDVQLRTHLARPDFLAALAVADLMVGNSSSGITEASSFGTPVLNVGRRQNLRERNANTTDVPITAEAVGAGLRDLLAHGRYPTDNIYSVPGGTAAERITAHLASAVIDDALLMKVNRY